MSTYPKNPNDYLIELSMKIYLIELKKEGSMGTKYYAKKAVEKAHALINELEFFMPGRAQK